MFPREGGAVPRHVLTMIGVTIAFFALLWFGVVVLKQSPGTTLVVSLLTLTLLGFGITYTAGTMRGKGGGTRDEG
jgi:hypothetical protein